MDEREKYAKKFKSLLLDKPFLLENSKNFMPIGDYLSFFVKKFSYGFIYISPAACYDVNLIDDFKDRIVYTTSLSTPNGGSALFSLVQVSPETHLYFTYVFIKDQFYVSVDIYTVEPAFILEFLQRYSDLEYSSESKVVNFGFGAVVK